MTDHEIYSRNVLPEKKGYAPWFPGSVDVAEVSCMKIGGGWIRLFDASKARGDHGAKPCARGSGGPLAYEANVAGKMSVAILLSLIALIPHVNTQRTE
jgi:hypothetical protein